MKKLLLASTALVASAGIAAADVALSGDGRMGVTYDSSISPSGDRFAFTSRARVTFTLSGETDTGLAFGGSFGAHNAPGAASGTAGSVFISGDFGRLTMGDTNGAAQFVTGHVAGVGLTGLGDNNNSVFLGNATVGSVTRPTARYDITIDGFTVAVSHTNPASADTTAAIGASYEFEGFTIGAGYESVNRRNNTNIDHFIISAGFAMDGIGIQANYGRINSTAQVAYGIPNRDQYSIGATGSFDDIDVSAFYARSFGGSDSFGVGASYDLGGGASLVGGIVRTNNPATGPLGVSMLGAPAASSRTLADFGISLSF